MNKLYWKRKGAEKDWFKWEIVMATFWHGQGQEDLHLYCKWYLAWHTEIYLSIFDSGIAYLSTVYSFIDDDFAKIAFPNEVQIMEYVKTIKARYPELKEKKIWCPMDGLKLYLERYPDVTTQIQ